eukprot:3032620-Lingulodinium_polyedra.AAC.1
MCRHVQQARRRRAVPLWLTNFFGGEKLQQQRQQQAPVCAETIPIDSQEDAGGVSSSSGLPTDPAQRE